MTDDKMVCVEIVAAGVAIAFEFRELVAGDFKSNAMTGRESIACNKRRDLDVIDVTGFHQHSLKAQVKPSAFR